MKIKSSKKYTTRFKQLAFGGDEDEEILTVSSIYDEKGNVVEEIRVDDDDNTEQHTFIYDANGKLIQHDLFIEQEGISESFRYHRDEKGRVLEETKFYGDDPGEKVIYTYGAHDQPLTIERFDADGAPESFEQIVYDDRDQLTEHHRFSPERELVEISKITYNEKGLPVEKIVTDSDGELVGETTFTYNEKNEPVRITEKNQSGTTISDIFSTYDDRGNVIERKIKDFHSRTLRFRYDERNNCIEEEVFDTHGNLTMKSNYEFDENNQLVAESGYYLDMNRGSQMANTHSRYEIEYY